MMSTDICRRFVPPATAELPGQRMPGEGASLTDQPAVRYVGRRVGGAAQVVRETEDGRQSPLPLRTDLRKHSPTGFEWGYEDSGPAQLALAILADAVGPTRAQVLYQDHPPRHRRRALTGRPH
ncbi:MAG: hypothetical protein JO252_26975 [Planctomycetaceae bacterium]|nr:hypothetical protein [Planctomycetaceae bacterium]